MLNFIPQGEVNWLFNVTFNDISVIYVTANRCAGGLKKKLDLRIYIDVAHGIDAISRIVRSSLYF